MAKENPPCPYCGGRTKRNGKDNDENKVRMLCLNSTDKECGKSFTLNNEPPIPKKDIMDFLLYAKNSNMLLTSKKFGISLYHLRKLINEMYPDNIPNYFEMSKFSLLKNYVACNDRMNGCEYDGRFDEDDAQKYDEKYTEKCNAIISELKNIIISRESHDITQEYNLENLSNDKLNKIFRYALNSNVSPYSVIEFLIEYQIPHNINVIEKIDSSDLSLTELKKLLSITKPKVYKKKKHQQE